MATNRIALETECQPRDTTAGVHCFPVETVYNRGARLKALRMKKGLSLEAVGAAVGTTKANVHKWEAKPNADMSLEVFFKLADLYEIDPRELATGTKSKHETIPPHRLKLIRTYDRLPEDMRQHIRSLIEALATAMNPRYQEWSRREAERAKKRQELVEK